ncbi:MAG: DUF4846 domain-containing protein [Marinilabiliales bacterium]
MQQHFFYKLAFFIIFFSCCKENLPQASTIGEIPLPDGFKRIQCDDNSFCNYLRNLKLNTDDNTVYLYNGEKKRNQSAQYAVIKMDIGNRDLQQCADAVMRLRAEYLFKQKEYDKIHFNFLSDGKPRYYKDYAGKDTSYAKFRKYLDYIFSYANTASLINELQNVNIKNIMPGDVFIQKGNPYGHAVIVVDVASNNKGEKIFLLAQSFMPAQNIHVLKNPINTNLSPWYMCNENEKLITPEWVFSDKDLKRFP